MVAVSSLGIDRTLGRLQSPNRRPLVPWLGDNPKRIVTWWEMKPFPVSEYLRYVRAFQSSKFDRSSLTTGKPEEIAAMESLAREAEEYSLFSVADQFRRIAAAAEYGTTDGEILELFDELFNRLQDECNRHVVMMIEPEYVKYIENPQFFDSSDPKQNKVSIQFPSAAEDIAESGKCLACARGTACVMHLNRVMEVGLSVLAKAVGVGPQNDWGRYLKGIDVELNRRFAASGARSPDEQFYAEAYTTFDSVRRAWRNPTMHVDKTYTVEHAEEILVAVRSFMRHLATRLSE